jgi:peptidoglycan L-alanyl-D-glutamate endopeptidase CwlK
MPYKYESHKPTMANLAGIHPTLRKEIEPILQRLEDEGYQPIIAEGLRTIAQQRQKVAKGYSKTMNSKHLTGRAVDVVDKRYLWNVGLDHPFFKLYGSLVNANPKLTWGGDWGKGYQRYLDYLAGRTKYFVDVAHTELKPNIA